MTLIKSISGIRGTIGGKVGGNLTPVDAVKFASAYGTFLKNNIQNDKLTVVIGRDVRISGPMIHNLVVNTLIGLGINVIDLGLSTTPTVEVAVPLEKADGGIILTASHNPKQWNALKLLNEKGEFISGQDGQDMLAIAAAETFDFADVDSLGVVTNDDSYMQKHIDAILDMPLVDKNAIVAANFNIVLDAVNSSGGKFGSGSYAASGGLHGVGASVVNALSSRLDVEVDRGGKIHWMSFQRGTAGIFDGDGPKAPFTPQSDLS